MILICSFNAASGAGGTNKRKTRKVSKLHMAPVQAARIGYIVDSFVKSLVNSGSNICCDFRNDISDRYRREVRS